MSSEIQSPPPKATLPPPGLEVERIIARVRGASPGPTLILLGGLHGNEPAGVLGAQRIAPELEAKADVLQGEFVAIAGNRAALREGRRYLVRDLNRAWTPKRIAALRANDGPLERGEDREQAELIEVLDQVFAEARGPVFVLDLHTTSGHGLPFSTAADTLRNRAFALAIPAPLVVGLEEQVEGTLMDWIDGLGHCVSVFESGQNRELMAVDRAVGAIWISLVHAGLLTDVQAPEAEAWRTRFREERGSVPRALEFRYRHAVKAKDQFKMRPGFLSFQTVKVGEVLAADRTGEIRATENARVLMPLYQSQGNDGFFLVREFGYFWLTLSAALRRAKADKIVHWLPGIRRDATGKHLIVNKKVARWFALQLLHLLGYRRQRESGRHLLVSRRPD